MASFENLVALANYQETLRDARKMVWRDRGEPAAELHTLMECLEHAVHGGISELLLSLTSSPLLTLAFRSGNAWLHAPIWIQSLRVAFSYMENTSVST